MKLLSIVAVVSVLSACGDEPPQCPDDCATDAVTNPLCRYDDCTPVEPPPEPDPAPTAPVSVGFNNLTPQTVTVQIRIVERSGPGAVVRDEILFTGPVVGNTFPVWQNMTTVAKGCSATIYLYASEATVSPSFTDTAGSFEHNCYFALSGDGLSGVCN